MATSEEFTITIRASDDGVISLIDNLGKKLGEVDSKLGKTTGVFKQFGDELEKQITKKFGPVGDAVEKTGQKVEKSEGAWSKIQARIVSLNQTLDIAGRAWSAAERAIGMFADELSRLDSIQDTAEAFGVSTEQVSRWGAAMQLAGANQAAFQQSLYELSKNLEDARAGIKRDEDAFKALGISLKDGQGHAKNLTQIMLELADASVKYGTSANTYLQKILGGATEGILPALQKGSKELKSYLDEADKLGATVATSTGRTAGAIDDQFNRLKVAWQGFKSTLVGAAAPAIEELTNKLSKFVSDFVASGDTARQWGDKIGEVLSRAINWVEQFIDKTKNMTAPDAFAEAWKTALQPAITAAAKKIAELFVQSLFDAMVALVESKSVVFALAFVGAVAGALVGGPALAVLGAVAGAYVGAMVDEFNRQADEAGATLDAKLKGQREALDYYKRQGLDLPEPPSGRAGLPLLPGHDFSTDDGLGGVREFRRELVGLTGDIERSNKSFNSQKESVDRVVDGVAYLRDSTTGARKEINVTSTEVLKGGKTWIVYKDALGNVVSEIQKLTPASQVGAQAMRNLEGEIAKSEKANEPFRLAAQGVITWTEAVRQSQAIQKTFNSDVSAGTLAIAQQREAVAQATTAAGNRNAQLEQQIAAIEAGNVAFEEAIKLGFDVGSAQRYAAEAAEDYANALLNEAIAGSDVEQAQRALIERLREAQRVRDEMAQDEPVKKQIEFVEYEIELQEQVLNGLINEYDMRIKLVAKMAEQNGQNVQLAVQLEKTKIQLENMRDTITHLGPGFKDALKELGSKAIRGDLSNIGELFSDMAKGWAEDIWGNMIDEKLRNFDPQVKGNFLDLANFGKSAFGSIFGSIGQLFGGESNSVGSFFTQAANFFNAGSQASEGGSAGGWLGSILNLFGGGGNSGGGILSSILNLFGGGGGGGSILGGIANIFGSGASPLGSALWQGGGMLLNGFYNPIPATQFVGPLLESGAQGTTGVGMMGVLQGLISSLPTMLGSAVGGYLGGKVGTAAGNALWGDAQSGQEEISRQVKTVVGAIIGTIAGIFTFGLGAIPALLGSFAGSAASGAAAANSNGSGLGFNINDKHFRGLGTGSQWGLGIMGALLTYPGNIFGLGENLIGRFAGKGVGQALTFLNPLALGAILGEKLGEPLLKLLFKGPTEGTLRRRAGESALDSIPTFKELQKQFGDVRRRSWSDEDVPEERERLGGSSTAMLRGFATLFAQQGFGEVSPEFLQNIAGQWTNILADMFARGEGSSAEFAALIREKLAAAFTDMGIDAKKGFEILNTAAKTTFGTTQVALDAFKEDQNVVTNFGMAVRGFASVMEQGLPAGVHIAQIALESMTKNGIRLFDDLTQAQRENLYQVTANAKTYDELVGILAEGGAEFDAGEIERRISAVAQSAEFVGQNLSGLLFSEDLESGIDGMISSLRSKLNEAFVGEVQAQLLDKTQIAGVFEEAFRLMDEIKTFDFTSEGGITQFGIEMEEALAMGEERLREYLPIIKRMQEAMKEALTPKTLEDFLARVPEIEDGIRQALSSGFQAALSATDKEAAVEAFGNTLRASVKQNIIGALIEGFTQGALLNSALAPLMAKLQYAISQAIADGVINAGEQAALKYLIDQIGASATGLINSLTPLVESLYDIVGEGVDNVKDRVDALQDALKSDFGNAANSFVQAIVGGLEEGGKRGFNVAFDAFTASVYDSMRNAILTAIVDAFTQAAIIEGALGPMLDAFKTHLSAAFADGILTDAEKEQIKGDMGGLGQGLRQAIEFLRPLLGDLYDVVMAGIDATEAPKSKAEVRSDGHGDITRDRTPARGSKDYERYEKLSEKQRELFAYTMDEFDLSIADSITAVEAFSRAIERQGMDVDTALQALADSAKLQGKSQAEVNRQYMQNLAALGDFSNVTVRNMNQMSTAVQQYAHVLAGNGLVTDKILQQAAVFDATLRANNIGLGDAVGEIQEIMREKGLSLQEATDYWITWVLSGGRAAEQDAKQQTEAQKAREDILAQEKAKSDEYINFLTGQIQDPTMKEAAKDAATEYAEMLRRQGLSEEEIRQKLAEEWYKAGGDARKFIENTGNLLEALREPADYAGGGLQLVGEKAPGAAEGLASVAEQAGRAATTLGIIGDGKKEPTESPPPEDARGGTHAASSMAIVGETGRPELVIGKPGGGFTVIPLDSRQYQLLTGHGVSMFGTGGTVGPSTDPTEVPPQPQPDPYPTPIRRPGTSPKGWGPGGPFITSPNDPRHPDYVDPSREESGETTKAQDALKSAIADAISQGFEEGKTFVEAFADSLRDNIYGAVSESLQDAFMKSAGVKTIQRELDKILAKIQGEFSRKGGGLTIEELRGYADEIDAQIQKAEVEAEKWEELFAEIERRRKDRALSKPVEVKLAFDMSDLARLAIEGASKVDFGKAFKQKVYEAVLDGIIEAVMASGPIAKEIEKFGRKMSRVITKALADGEIDEEERRHIERIARNSGKTIEEMLLALGPVGAAIAEALGIELRKELQQSADLIGSTLKGMLNDPSKLNMETFKAALKQNIYQSVAQGLIDAFIQTAVIQGALAVPLGIINATFAAVMAGQMSVAEANVAIAGQIAAILEIINGPEFEAMIQTLLDGVSQLANGLGITNDAVVDTAGAVGDAADATNDLANATINWQRAVADLGLVDLNQVGRTGGLTIESFVPVNPDGTPWQDPTRPRRFAEGGLVTRETLGILGDAGPELVIPLTKVKDTLGGKDDKKSTKELLKELQAIRKELAAMRAEQGDLSIDMDGQRLGKLQRKARRVARKAGQRVE